MYKDRTIERERDNNARGMMEKIEDRAMYDQAKSFSQNISKGNVQVKHSSDSEKIGKTPY